jgi:hypothetical protein
MMEINSNCRLNEPNKKEDKPEHLSEDNKSLGINTIRSFEQKPKNNPSLASQSSLSSESNSR